MTNSVSDLEAQVKFLQSKVDDLTRASDLMNNGLVQMSSALADHANSVKISRKYMSLIEEDFMNSPASKSIIDSDGKIIAVNNACMAFTKKGLQETHTKSSDFVCLKPTKCFDLYLNESEGKEVYRKMTECHEWYIKQNHPIFYFLPNGQPATLNIHNLDDEGTKICISRGVTQQYTNRVLSGNMTTRQFSAMIEGLSIPIDEEESFLIAMDVVGSTGYTTGLLPKSVNRFTEVFPYELTALMLAEFPGVGLHKVNGDSSLSVITIGQESQQEMVKRIEKVIRLFNDSLPLIEDRINKEIFPDGVNNGPEFEKTPFTAEYRIAVCKGPVLFTVMSKEITTKDGIVSKILMVDIAGETVARVVRSEKYALPSSHNNMTVHIAQHAYNTLSEGKKAQCTRRPIIVKCVTMSKVQTYNWKM